MSLLDMLMGGNTDTTDRTSLGNRAIASDMLKDSKFTIMSLGQAVSEITDLELRQILASQLVNAINQHYKLSDLVTNKDWYQPFLSPTQQLSQDVSASQQFVDELES